MASLKRKRAIFFILLVFSCSLLLFHSKQTTFSRLFERYPILLTTIRHPPVLFLMRNNERRWLQLEKKYLNTNISLLWNSHRSDNYPLKTLIYQCKSLCGGLGDRFRGIITCYFLALVTDRHFMIDMTYPIDIKDFLVPNKYNWTFITIKSNSSRSYTTIKAISETDSLVQYIRDKPFHQEWAKFDDVMISTNLDLLADIFRNPFVRHNKFIDMFSTRSPLVDNNMHNLFPLLFEILFQPSIKVSNTLQPILQQVEDGSTMVCLHLRIGQNPSNPLDASFADRVSSAEDIITFLHQSKLLEGRATRLFVASDSAEAVSKVRHAFSNQTLVIPGPILHVDRPAGNISFADGFLKVVTAFYALGECHTSVFVASGFSALANRRRTEPYKDLYKYDAAMRRIERCHDIYGFSDHEPLKPQTIAAYCRVIFNCSSRQMK